MKVQNKHCVRRLSMRTLRANRTRNMVAVAAIALTAMLFTALFTIALSINEGFQQSNFRQVGGYSHGGFKYLTEEQYNDLKDDPLIEEAGLRRFLGMPYDVPFNKSHVEIGYSDANEAKWQYCEPVEGRLPKEGTNEAATDLKVLKLLGVEPEIGKEFTVTFDVAGHETTQTFTLCGWWEYDEMVVANHILVPESRVDAVLDEVGVTEFGGSDHMFGSWNLDVMLDSGSRHIEEDLNTILANHGYTNASDGKGENAIDIGVNWGYTGAQLSESMDMGTVAAIVAMLLLIIFTGYLIIYNVFQISVAGDIRFYGLLKTIGTTPRQLKRIIRLQALVLSVIGIPIGLVLGWLIGRMLVPVVIAQLDGVVNVVSVSPAIFIISALFALVTVFISVLRPGRLAGRVSPIEALRYTESAPISKRKARNKKGVSLFSMALANLGRNRAKTVVTILSLALAVVLFTVTVTFTNGFDMDKYLKFQTAVDFQVADASYFQTGQGGFYDERALPEDTIAMLEGLNGVTEGGRTYGLTVSAQEFISEDWFRKQVGQWYDEDALDKRVEIAAKDAEGRLAHDVQLYGMEDFPLSLCKVYEGSLDEVKKPGSRAIAAVYAEDDYGALQKDSHWAKVGDTVTVRYVDEWEWVDPETDKVYSDEALPESLYDSAISRAKTFHEETYTVAATVSVPGSLSYRYYGDDEFILNAETFKQDTASQNVLYYAFNCKKGTEGAITNVISDYTENVNPSLDFENKDKYVQHFNGFRNMFLLMGGALSGVICLVGLLNFFNAIITGITARRRELAVLQSIGMTATQQRKMLAIEGLLYTVGAIVLSLALTLALAPLLSQALSSMFWFFTYHLTLWPILVMLPLFAVIGVLVPMVSSRIANRRSVVDRLRQE